MLEEACNSVAMYVEPSLKSHSSESSIESSAASLLETAVQCAKQLPKSADDKYDFDTKQGQEAARRYLACVESLCEAFEVKTKDRAYREQFSEAYRVLYTEGCLCYLTEIIDSAQERVPFLWVNGEKYVFSDEVLTAGVKLFSAFEELQSILTRASATFWDSPELVEQLEASLLAFDHHWTDYEHMYVLELMVIEADARRFIRKAAALSEVADVSHEARQRLIKVFGKLNSVANVEGKGRSDLTVDILAAAEAVDSAACGPLRRTAAAIQSSFEVLRNLIKYYSTNLDEVDPQLKNNAELAEALFTFEVTWEKGKQFILHFKRQQQLTHFFTYIEGLCTTYPQFREQVEWRDATVFLAVPELLLLLKLEENDCGLCRLFCPALDDVTSKAAQLFKKLQRAYNFGKLASVCPTAYRQLLEQAVLGIGLTARSFVEARFDNLDACVNKLKQLGMELQRGRPVKWNQFLDVLLA